MSTAGDTPAVAEPSGRVPATGAGLLDLALLLARYRRMIAVATLAGTAAMLVVSLTLPKWYQAEVRMLAPKRSGMPGMSLGGGSGALAAMDLLGIMGGGSEPNFLASILQSRTVTDTVIAKFNLRARYRVATIEETRMALLGHARVDVDRKSGVVALKVEDKEPQVAHDLAQAFADEASKLNNHISSVRAGQERRFLEARLKESRRDLERAEVAMKEFSAKHKVLDLREQTKVSIQAVARLRGEISTRDVMLSYLSSFAGEGEANKSRLQRETAELKRQLARLEEGAQAAGGVAVIKGGAASSVVSPIASLPELGLEYARLFRELKIQETIFELLTKQHELSKLAEASDTATAQVIDPPVVPTRKVRPKRATYVVVGFMLSFLGALVVARLREGVKANPATAARWRAVRAALRRREGEGGGRSAAG